MTVDVEDYFQVSAFSQSIALKDWDSLEYRAEVNTEKLLRIFDEFDVKATFFVLGWIAQRSPELIRSIQVAGHEVACHGLNHQLVYRQTLADFTEETRRSKLLLEDITGEAVRGYRAASWSITSRSLWALDVLIDLGFEYDSSVFPIRHDRYGIPGASPWPGMIESPDGRSIVEFPPSTVPVMGTRLPVAGGGYFRLLPYKVTQMGLRRVNRDFNRPFIFYLHPWEIDPNQPRIEASWLSRFRHYTNLARTETRLRRMLSEFRFTTVSNVLTNIHLLDSKA